MASSLSRRREPETDNASNDSKSDERAESDGGENGGQDQYTPKPVGFWDPRLTHVRHEAMRKWTYTSLSQLCWHDTRY
jgi:hypothetical protein